MHQDDILIQSSTGENLRLLRKRESGIYTYVVTDEKGVPVICKRTWSARPDLQLRLIRTKDTTMEDLFKIHDFTATDGYGYVADDESITYDSDSAMTFETREEAQNWINNNNAQSWATIEEA